MYSFRRAILIAYGLSFLLVCLWVPWERVTGWGGMAESYSLIWSPPLNSRVDLGRVLLEIMAISVSGGVLFLLAPWLEAIVSRQPWRGMGARRCEPESNPPDDTEAGQIRAAKGLRGQERPRSH